MSQMTEDELESLIERECGPVQRVSRPQRSRSFNPLFNKTGNLCTPLTYS